MECPKCGSRIKKDMPVCAKCGFRVDELENVSNIKAQTILKHGSILEREKIFYTYKVPKDLMRKDLVLFTIFLGLFGAHNFYVGRIWLGISKVLSFIIGVVLALIIYYTGLYTISSICGLFIAYPFISWVYDIFRVVIKRYPIPVVLDSEN